MAQWAQIIQERKASGENIENYCQNRGLSKNTYFYWQRKLKEAACEQLAAMESISGQTSLMGTGFTEIKIRGSQPFVPYAGYSLTGQVSIEARGVKINADAAYPATQLTCLLRELVATC